MLSAPLPIRLDFIFNEPYHCIIAHMEPILLLLNVCHHNHVDIVSPESCFIKSKISKLYARCVIELISLYIRS